MTVVAALAVAPRVPWGMIAPDVYILASVTMQIGPVVLSGCNLTHSPGQGHRLLLTSRSRDERAAIICPITRRAALAAALAAYNDEINPPAAKPVAKAPDSMEAIAT